jgi:hypothetical protein
MPGGGAAWQVEPLGDVLAGHPVGSLASKAKAMLAAEPQLGTTFGRQQAG